MAAAMDLSWSSYSLPSRLSAVLSFFDATFTNLLFLKGYKGLGKQ